MYKLTLIAIVALFLLISSAKDDFYQLLEIETNADESEIRKAFRKQSIRYHPDKNPGDADAAEKFRRINRANEVLTNGDKRYLYDTYGEETLEKAERGERQFHRGSDTQLELSVSLEELYSGTERFMTVTREVVCNSCKGTGAKNGKVTQCSQCGGKGVVLQNVQFGMGMQMQMQTHCPKCQGKGTMFAEKCTK